MARAYGFTQDGAKRVGAVVRRVESEQPGLRQRRRRDRRVPDFRVILGKTDAAHNKGSAGTVSIYSGATQGSETDTTNNVTVYNRFADVESGKWVLVIRVGNGWEMIAAEC